MKEGAGGKLMSIDKMFSLEGKVALVTGAAQWIGWDIATVFAEAGASVIITSRDLSKAQKAAERLAAEYGCSALGIDLEVGDPRSVARCFHRVKEWKGRLDILVNNAGGGSGRSEGNILRRDPVDQESLVRANLLGVLYCCQAAAKIMTEQRSGVIINIASIAGLVGRDRRMYEQNSLKGQPVDYAASKAGVIGLTRDLAAALGPYGIRVNSISPGGFEKPGELPRKFVEEYAQKTILGRWGRMGVDMKGPALFLASSASEYVTGHNLVVDGGFSVVK